MPRIKSFDLARGFTVLCMVPVHSMLLYSQPAVYPSLPGQLLAFVAEGPGAPLFMLLMGVNFYLHPPTREATLRKAGWLLMAGYGLNLVKFVLPYVLGCMPAGLRDDLQVPDTGGAFLLLGVGDILSFAALALLILYGVSRFRYSRYVAAGLALIICWVAPFTWDAHSPCPLLNYVLQLVTGHAPRTFFPLFPWLVYPLVGLALGREILRDARFDSRVFFQRSAWTGALLVLLSLFFSYGYPSLPAASFYRPWPHETMGHLGVVFLALAGWGLLDRFVTPNLFWRVLSYSSRHITLIYLIQWPLLFLWLPVVGYQRLDLPDTLLVMIPMTGATYFLSALLKKYVHL
jgi:uncharacterized membrane protein